MKYYFSPTTCGFYPEEFRSMYESANTWPSDAVVITQKTYDTYSKNAPAGKARGAVDGKPAWVDVALPDRDLAKEARYQRNLLLDQTDWLAVRHRDQIDAKTSTALSETKYTELQEYRNTLRDLPLQPGFPDNIVWPTFQQ